MAIPAKPRKCRVCKSDFQPHRCLQQTCSYECEVKLGLVAIAKSKAKREKDCRVAEMAACKDIRIRKEALKTPKQKRKELIQQAEKSVRDVRRTEELQKGSGCISCGRSQQEVIGTDGWKPGGAFDAGHYHGKGARPNLRLEPDNIWLQCKSCNGGSSKYARKGAAVAKQYRESLIEILGVDRVEELDSDDTPRHWTDEELITIRDANRARLKELKHG